MVLIASVPGHCLHFCLPLSLILDESRHEKTNVLVSDLVRHKPGCTSTEVGLRLEISDLIVEGLYYLCSENKDADLRLYFRICKMLVFS